MENMNKNLGGNNELECFLLFLAVLSGMYLRRNTPDTNKRKSQGRLSTKYVQNTLMGPYSNEQLNMHCSVIVVFPRLEYVYGL